MLVVAGALTRPLPEPLRVGALVAVGVVTLVAERRWLGLRLPQTEHQIPPSVVAARRPSSAWTFGRIYGTGLFTYLPTAAPHVLALACVLVASTPEALLAGAAFGLGRGLPQLVRAASRHRLQYESVLQRFAAGFAPVAALVTLASCVVASVR